MKPRTMFEKIWDAHLVRAASADTPAVLYVDLHLIHEVTSPQAFTWLRERGLKVRRPERTVATMDHSTPTTPRDRNGKIAVLDNAAALQIAALEKNCADFGIELHKLGTDGQGIVHVIGPEMGLTQPGTTIVCGDSHTSTHGAFGALAFGIGTSEVSHVLATQSLLQQPPKTLAVTVEGQLRPGVTAKDIMLAIIARLGIGGGTGYVIEYRGSAIRALSMEERMTVCNMSIEAGARAGMIAPDETTFAYLKGRPRAPQGAAWDKAVAAWKSAAHRPRRDLRSRREVRRRHAGADDHLRHQPGNGHADPRPRSRRPTNATAAKALAYMGLDGQTRAARPQGRRGVHRKLHQLAALRLARGRHHLQGPQGGRRRARAGRPGLAGHQEGGRGRGPRSGLPARPAPSGARPAARCASP